MSVSPGTLAIVIAVLGLFLGGAVAGIGLARAFAPGSWVAETVSFFALPIAFAAGLQMRAADAHLFGRNPMFRWLILSVLVSALTVSGYHRARARLGGETVARRQEGSLLLALRGVIALGLFGGTIAHAVKPEWMAWASFDVPQPLRWLGFGVGVLAVAAVHWILKALGRNVTETVLTKEHHELVTGRPYRWIRHPLYTTGLTLFLALGLMAGSWFVLLATILAFALLRALVIPLEEQALLAKFGERYRAYMSTTGRLMPRVGGGYASGAV